MIKYTLGFLFERLAHRRHHPDNNSTISSWGLAPNAEEAGSRGELTTDDEIGVHFIQAAERADYDHVADYIQAGHDVNFQHPVTRQTALHLAAGYGDRALVRTIIGSGASEFGIKDRNGKTAADIAFEEGPDPVIARYLTILCHNWHASRTEPDWFRTSPMRLSERFNARYPGSAKTGRIWR